MGDELEENCSAITSHRTVTGLLGFDGSEWMQGQLACARTGCPTDSRLGGDPKTAPDQPSGMGASMKRLGASSKEERRTRKTMCIRA